MPCSGGGEGFLNSNIEGVLLVDASNAFNALQNTCPSLAKVLINTYCDLFVGGSSLLSQEGTTQGDPLAMPISTTPLINSLPKDVQQVWYALRPARLKDMVGQINFPTTGVWLPYKCHKDMASHHTTSLPIGNINLQRYSSKYIYGAHLGTSKEYSNKCTKEA